MTMNLKLFAFMAFLSAMSLPAFSSVPDFEDESSWVFSTGDEVSRRDSLKAEHVDQTKVRSLFYYKAIGGVWYLKIEFESSFYDSDLTLQEDYAPLGKYSIYSNCMHNYKGCEASLLRVAYDHSLVPDFVVTRFIEKMGVDDFRLHGCYVLDALRGDMYEGMTAEEFSTLIFAKIKEVKLSKQQTILWEIIQKLTVENPIEDPLMIFLLSGLTDPTQEFYNESRTLLASTFMGSEHLKPDQCYESAITALLQAHGSEEVKRMIQTFSVAYYHNAAHYNDGGEVPEVLSSFTGSPESTFNLLTLARDQQNEIKELKERLTKLEE